MNVKIKILNDLAQVPVYQTEGAVACDLVATSETIDQRTGAVTYGTGIAIELPDGYEGQIRSRSSVRDKDIVMANGVGTLDADYRSELFVTFKPLRERARKYAIGDRIAQLVISPVAIATFVVVEELTETARGSGGFGSTGT